MTAPGFTRKETENTGDGSHPNDVSFRLHSHNESVHSDRVSVTSIDEVLGNHALQNKLIKTEKANQISSSIKVYVQALPELNPKAIPEIKDRYDSNIKTSGPYLEPTTGVTYVGQVKEGIANGWGKVITKQGDFVEGFFSEGTLDGFCRQLTRKGRYYEGGIMQGQKHGKGHLVDATRIRIECLWDRGQPTGPTKIYDKNNTVLFEGESVDGLLAGDNCYYKDKVRNFEYRGSFRKGKINGYGRKKFANKDVYEGQFLNGVEEGSGSLTLADGLVIKGSFSNGKPHGDCRRIKPDGTTEKVTYINGVIQPKISFL